MYFDINLRGESNKYAIVARNDNYYLPVQASGGLSAPADLVRYVQPR